MNEENLKKGKATQFKSGEEAAKSGRKGGIASGKSRKAKKTMREAAQIALELTVGTGKKVDIEAIKSLAKVNGKNITVQDALILTLVKNGLAGNMKALEMLIELTETSNQAGATAADDELSASLKELAEELKSDERF